MHRVFDLRFTAVLLIAGLAVPAPLAAQFEALPGLGGGAAGAAPSPISVRAVIVAAEGNQPVRLAVTADIQPGWNTYSITQPPGGQIRTKIKVDPSLQYKVGEFQSVEAPDIHPEPAFDNLLAEEHRGSVTWFAPLELSAGVDVATLEIKGAVFAQACEKTCIMPKDHAFAAKKGEPPVKLPAVTVAALSKPAESKPAPATTPPPQALAPNLAIPGIAPLPAVVAKPPVAESIGTYTPPFSKLKWTAKLEPPAVAPGGKARLLFTAEMQPKWHVYAVDKPQTLGNQATLFVVTDARGMKVSPPVADREPTPPHGEAAVAGAKLLPYFTDKVTWSLDVEAPADAKAGQTMKLAGVLGFQTCDEGNQCLRPESVRFDVPLTIGPGDDAIAAQPVRFFDPQPYRIAADLATGKAPAVPQIENIGTDATSSTLDYDIKQIQIQSQDAASPLPVMLGIGLLAGFILNFMPCVLPVIGLKVLSFVEQGGHDRRRVLMLNLWYSLGIVSVFWILATIPVVLRAYGETYGWGQQFSYDAFNITLVGIVFVMALSFLGVWEIPIPGFAGSKQADDLASKEGGLGAFVKGMLTTVLATPCSGPFLGTAVAFALGSSPAVTYAMFTAMGLGMAAPYLLIGFQPGLIRFLPRPGEWMDTFKQIMGFVLIGTVIWLMLPIDKAKVMPTLVLLAGLSAACWWIGRTPGYAELPHKLKAWGQATVFAGIVGWLAFAMPQVTDPLPWQHDFTLAKFVKQVDSGKTVMLEFTAKWCLTCKTMKAANLDREKTKERVVKNGVVVYEIDIDEISSEELAFFSRMQPSQGVPLIAIFPAGKKYEPIHFEGAYTQSQILNALDEAGPSKKTTDVAERDGVKLGMQ